MSDARVGDSVADTAREGSDEARRRRLFRESAIGRLRRWALGLAWPLRPDRAQGLPGLARMWVRERLSGRSGLPDPEAALAQPPGLAGFVHDLSAPTLVAGYRLGLYPFGHVGPLKWWSPPERCVLPAGELHLSRRLRSYMRQNRHRVTFDRDFEGVIAACAEPRDGKFPLTWITPKIMRAYAELFDAGFAHSFEVWDGDGALVGGGYGVASGGVFVIESQFARQTHASKVGFAVLDWHLARWGFALSDNKHLTENVARMGFRNIPRAEYLERLKAAQLGVPRATWQVEADPATVAAAGRAAESAPRKAKPRAA